MTRPGLRSVAALLGPALVASAAYVDPGNVATNTAAGATYGYLLVWVVVGANLIAALLQFLSAKLGIVTGRSLPAVLRDRLSGPWRIAYWVQAEVVAMATDLAEIVGGALALSLLFGVPLLPGALITTAVSLLILGSSRSFHRIVVAMLCVVFIGFTAGLVFAPPSAPGIFSGLVPRLEGTDSLLLAVGMLGATVMPHAIYAHSALAADRHGKVSPERLPTLLTATRTDVGVALLAAGAVNLALLLLGATALSGAGDMTSIEGVHAALGHTLGPLAALFFAVALLFSGLASTAVGGYAGGVIMGGLLSWDVPVMARRLITAVPAVTVLALGADPTTALIYSQVVLSFGIPFALIPLLLLTSSRSVMGANRNGPWTTLAASAACVLIVGLNLVLLALTFG
ncbi:Nramp family divalent metal transporter [Kineosporia sp. NBRC 101731]|uniref:Nramp family divalent metal transporter n=1 Tax=Kineosporia sp. NBRC 101731 TaxID=3032199 RepID=UPI0024A58905|nr:Nramp family divalent metal transporter [Kineosporia sp. NBRC 101731]GLY33249.1 divalent metal cation transporter MntH [Kineosporia sp. NBRC 101731]